MDTNKKTAYFEKETVPLKFRIHTDNPDIYPLMATASVYRGIEEISQGATCEIEESPTRKSYDVSYLVPSALTVEAGDYRAYFVVSFTHDIVRTHVVRFHISSLMPDITEEDRKLMHIDEKSSDYEVDQAMNRKVRQLRRAGVDLEEIARITRDLVENLTGKRM